jgi:hypothetical protein
MGCGVIKRCVASRRAYRTSSVEWIEHDDVLDALRQGGRRFYRPHGDFGASARATSSANSAWLGCRFSPRTRPSRPTTIVFVLPVISKRFVIASTLAAQPRVRPGHRAVRCAEPSDGRPFFVERDADDRELLATVLGVQLFERGDALAAAAAPHRPQVQHDHTAAQVGELERRLALGVRQQQRQHVLRCSRLRLEKSFRRELNGSGVDARRHRHERSANNTVTSTSLLSVPGEIGTSAPDSMAPYIRSFARSCASVEAHRLSSVTTSSHPTCHSRSCDSGSIEPRVAGPGIDRLEALLALGPAIMVATRDADRRLHMTRGWGGRVDASSGRLDLALTVTDDLRVVADLEANGVIAVTLVNPRNYQALQITGLVEWIGEVGPDDRTRIDAHRERFVDAVGSVGLPPSAGLLAGTRFVAVRVAMRGARWSRGCTSSATGRRRTT